MVTSTAARDKDQQREREQNNLINKLQRSFMGRNGEGEGERKGALSGEIK